MGTAKARGGGRIASRSLRKDVSLGRRPAHVTIGLVAKSRAKGMTRTTSRKTTPTKDTTPRQRSFGQLGLSRTSWVSISPKRVRKTQRSRDRRKGGGDEEEKRASGRPTLGRGRAKDYENPGAPRSPR